MSNQFYNYIVNELIEFWTSTEIKQGERYFLRLDSLQEVEAMYQAFKDNTVIPVENINYQHTPEEEVYETICLPIKNIKLVIAATLGNIQTDYLALIRNLISDEEEGWEDTALVSIIYEQLDTLTGGSTNLQVKGMPLYAPNIKESLEENIKSSSLSNSDKIILESALKDLLKEFDLFNLTLFDFEEIFTIISQGKLSSKDYAKLGLFRDPEIDSFKGRSLTSRIEENRGLFERVQRAHNFGDMEEELGKYFTDQGINQLKKEDWFEIPFTEIWKDREKYKRENESKKVIFKSITVENIEKEKVWRRNGKSPREHHIIIFNEEELKEVTLKVTFDLRGKIKSLQNQYSNLRGKDNKIASVETKQKTVLLTIDTTSREAPFIKYKYAHEKVASLGVTLFITVVPISPNFLRPIQTNYLVNAAKSAIEMNLVNDQLEFGEGKVQRTQDINSFEEQIQYVEDEALIVYLGTELFYSEEDLIFNLVHKGKNIRFYTQAQVRSNRPSSVRELSTIVRETKVSAKWNEDHERVEHQNDEYYLTQEAKDFLKYEAKWLDEAIRYAKLESGSLIKQDIQLPLELREAYSRYQNFFKDQQLPSLTYVCEEYRKRALEYIDTYCKTIQSFKQGVPVGNEGMDLFRLGTIRSSHILYLTPFHPLTVAYKLKMYEELTDEKIENVILDRLSSESLMPFIVLDELYQSQYQQEFPDWIVYKPADESTTSDSAQYLEKVITDKIKQFKKHFSYLFTANSKAPLLVSVINIPDDFQVLRAILQYMNDDIIENKANSIKPVEVTLFMKESINSAFEKFSMMKTTKEVIDFTNIKFGNRDHAADEIIRIIRENLFFYKKDKKNLKGNLTYSHIVFYKMLARENHSIRNMNQMPHDLSLDGLYASVPSKSENDSYITGFGIENYTVEEKDYLINVACNANELAANIRNDGSDSYNKNHTILSRLTVTDEEIVDFILDNANWVTFIDPIFDLSYFNEKEDDLIVIHYSDQYSTSKKLDAVTVTNRSEQYEDVIKDFLLDKGIENTDLNIRNTIKAFNTFNGEWLLRIIGTKNYYDREKLSLISAIKYTLALLEHPSILWVPISLEELLRVAGVFNLTKADGVLSAKNLGMQGSVSDDLLLIGLETRQDDLLLHFYPVEVKIGINSNSALDKAKTQVKKTKETIMNILVEEHSNFKKDFYKNFFVQLFLANLEKIRQGDIWPEKEYVLPTEIIEKLVKLDFKITDHLQEYIGEGAIVSFKEGIIGRSTYIEDEIFYMNLTKEDGYEKIVQPIEELRNWIVKEESDFKTHALLSNQYTLLGTNTFKEVEVKTSVADSLITSTNQDQDLREYDEIKEPESTADYSRLVENDTSKKSNYDEQDNQDKIHPISTSKEEISLEQVRLKIGTLENSSKEIYWEYGHKDLPNRHLLISGKSGQGKTYFMQCLLYEMSKSNLSSIIVDYTEGFLTEHLEEEFMNELGDKIHQRLVYRDKLPINPFKRNSRLLGDIEIPEDDIDIAERVKSVFSSVYRSLGIQQQNAIYECVIRGLQRYGDKMNLSRLRELLEEANSTVATKTLSQLRPFIDRDPFTAEEAIDWKDWMNRDGDILIIQLTIYPRDVQLIIAEFLLWDLWNYSIREGREGYPLPVIMDESQNLDHTEYSPSAKILTEGRKFGWSGWYATQFLKSQLEASELARLQNAAQKIYFAPTDQELSTIASSLETPEYDRKYWEQKLSKLKKGQCIVQGPHLLPDGSLSESRAGVVDIDSLSSRK